MKCKNCGAELKPDSRFCRKCGAPLETETGASVNTGPPAYPQMPSNSGEPKQITAPEERSMDEQMNPYPDVEPDQEKETGRKKKGSKWILAILAVVILIAGIGGGTLIVNARRTSEYQETLSLANRYYNKQDYERAEELYLQSIEILPKQKDPYVQLVQLYAQTEQPEKTEVILVKAQENLPAPDVEEVKQESVEAVRQVEEQKAEALKKIGYSDYAVILRSMLDSYIPMEYWTNDDFPGNRLPLALSEPILKYTLMDFTQDGVDELYVEYDGGLDEYKITFVLTYHPQYEHVRVILWSNAEMTPMTNGFFKAIWPAEYSLFDSIDVEIQNFNSDFTAHETRFYIEEVNKEYTEEIILIRTDGTRIRFPEELDKDNDHLLYRVKLYPTLEELFFDRKELDEWIYEKTGGARSMDITLEPVTPEVIAMLEGNQNGVTEIDNSDSTTEESVTDTDQDQETAIHQTGELVASPDYSIFPQSYSNTVGYNEQGEEDPEGIYLDWREDGRFYLQYYNPHKFGPEDLNNHLEFNGDWESLRKVNDLHYTVEFCDSFSQWGISQTISEKYPIVHQFGSDLPNTKMHIFLKGYPTKNLSNKILSAIGEAYKTGSLENMSELPEAVVYLEAVDLALIENEEGFI